MTHGGLRRSGQSAALPLLSIGGSPLFELSVVALDAGRTTEDLHVSRVAGVALHQELVASQLSLRPRLGPAPLAAGLGRLGGPGQEVGEEVTAHRLQCGVVVVSGRVD